jgi:hypothetical protein
MVIQMLDPGSGVSEGLRLEGQVAARGLHRSEHHGVASTWPRHQKRDFDSKMALAQALKVVVSITRSGGTDSEMYFFVLFFYAGALSNVFVQTDSAIESVRFSC